MRARKWHVPEEAGIFVVLIVVWLAMAAMSPAFRTVSNTWVLLLNGAVIAFLALGQVFVLLTGGIDLSTGANVSMTGVLVALYMQHGMPWPVAGLLTLACGTFLGVVNGTVIHYVRVPAFIVTFSTLGVASSIPLIITGANSISVLNSGFTVVGQGHVLGTNIPVPVVMLVVAAVLASLLLSWTRFGRHIYAVGGNASAARLAGVNIARTTIAVYALSGLCAAIGGVISTSRLMVGFPATGTGNELFFSIAAAVVGGVSLFGGVGSVAGAMIGAVLISTVSDGMNILNVSSYWQPLAIGVIILAGVSLDTYRRSVRGLPLPGVVLRILRREQKQRADAAGRAVPVFDQLIPEVLIATPAEARQRPSHVQQPSVSEVSDARDHQ
jgi:ribose transport system permease protein